MSYLTQVLEQAAVVGGPVDEVLEPVRVFRRRADELNARLDAARAASERQHGAVVTALAEGRESDLAVAAQHTAAAEAWAYDSPASKLVVEAVAECHRRAEYAMPALAPTLFAEMQALCAAVVAESVTATAKLPRDLSNVESVLRAGPDALGAWQRLDRLTEVFAQVHRLAELLRNSGWIPGPPTQHGGFDRPTGRTKYLHPELLSAEWAAQPPPLLLGTAAAVGAGPGLYDWEDARVRQVRYDRQAGRAGMHAPTSVTAEYLMEQEQPQQPMTLHELSYGGMQIAEANAQASVQHIPAPAVT